MRNYLTDEEMNKVLCYVVEKLKFDKISSLILTANDITSHHFLKPYKNWEGLQTLILSRNKLHNIEVSDYLELMPHLKLLDLSQNFITQFQTKGTSNGNGLPMHSNLLQLNLSRNRI